ncbi:UDP-4-amino-4,6-dideoxy-N-acetyl-beta-L-altrosamine transaminase [Noviherbaspirillum galbum]|uniref:UDP-4-amino-4, 6-dideoxy-N-acetyl-beta-L-altrosamine transaminase n=1 Tax=Noviherbaspirillum galbum TaxID=2709383 RepID=A0A6B3SFN0_9BURK|nr:UDP-4-amino-4,6-dideoxy-N-acetyl-beta-L-altrosamine transaminase [Noviherbaspirillum galbum]NEX59664.1 UDP-4-amino-4,6-dideoxy-N-acetyl-beta-L-altrosamine transaminase [Noviherbaspirillum galbum]
MIPYGRQSIDDDDVRAVEEVLRSDWLTQGPAIDRFEQALAEYCGAAYAVAVCNATAALHIACLALGVGEGDIVWTSPNTFVASANCARYCGATIGFVDIDPRTYNMSVSSLEDQLRHARAVNALPKVVIPVHFAGQSCDMQAIHALSQEYGFRIIEDASHAVGADYLDGKVGDCRYSDMTVFSFHPVKILTTAEGGMVLTNRPELCDALRRLRSHGITRDPAAMEKKDEGPWYYEQIELGYNYRMTDLQAALGLSQLRRLPEFVARRRALARRYDAMLAGLPLRTPYQAPDGVSAFHLYPVWIDEEKAGRSRRAVFDDLRARGIGVNVLYIPVPLQPDYRKLGFAEGQFPEAERYYRGAISLPLYFSLSDEQQDQVVAAVKGALS